MRAQSVVLIELYQNVKSSLFDMISIIKENWDISHDLKKQFDVMLKDMMLTAQSKDDLLEIT